MRQSHGRRGKKRFLNSGNGKLPGTLSQGGGVIDKDDKLVDIVMKNERLLLVLSRFGIMPGFGDKTVGDVCNDYQLDTTLVLLVINVFNNRFFTVGNNMVTCHIPGLIDYLKHAHRYYLEEKLPYISWLIDRFIENTENPDTVLLRSFFKEYADEVNDHMQLEDVTAFPYILALYGLSEGMEVDREVIKYTIDEFAEHHTNIEEKLEDLVFLLIKYFPPTKDLFYRNTIVIELFALQYDLNDHARVEDRILVPMVRELEHKIKLK